MTRKALLTAALLLAAACASTPPASTAAAPAASIKLEKIDLYRFNGKFVGSVELNGQPLLAWVSGSEAGVTAEKYPVLAVSYSARPADDAASVDVFALYNDGTARTEGELKKVPVGTYRLGPGQSMNVDGLSKFGMPPMMLRGIARLEQ